MTRREEPRRPQASGYERRFTESEERSERWVRIAESDPVTGSLRWLDGWERRAAGWTPLREWLR